jgi:serine protease Do
MLPLSLPETTSMRSYAAPLAVLGACALLLPLLRRAGTEEKAPLDFEAVIETAKRQVYPALVFVKPVQEDLSEGEKRRVEVLGSGVIFRADGYVVTNHHVAEKAKEIRCVLGDRRQVGAKVVGLDKQTDLAVLKLDVPEGEKLPFAEFGRSADIQEGAFVMALGSPYGFERSISLGIVSNARRHLGGEGNPYNNWIQTDAAINPGNSGGPLVNTRGQVVGINTLAIRMANNLGFAIPVDVVRLVVDRLLKDGRIVRSRHGITLRALVDYMQNTIFEGDEGVIVDDVAAASAAEAAGIRKGDRILSVAKKATDGKYQEDLPALRWRLADLPAGEPAEVVVLRDGKRLALAMTPEPDGGTDEGGLECDRWDATFQRITPEEVPDLHFWRPNGIYVLGVSYPGNAASAGLRPQDVVVTVDRQPVKDLPALKALYEKVMKENRAKKQVLVEVLRNGLKRYVALEYERDYDPKEKEKGK